jgi:hypothetical protein
MHNPININFISPNMGKDLATAISKADRRIFFDYHGHGRYALVMRFITPAAVGSKPEPGTTAFWCFAAPGLLADFIFTYPLNWLLVSPGRENEMA